MKLLVILASYNGEKYIREQIDSILNQEEVNVDIFVFDDCSKDNTCGIIKTYNQESRIKLVKNNSPQGSAANNFFNAIKSISDEVINGYDFVAFADQDDIWLPEKLKAASTMLIKAQSSLYCSNLILWDEKSNSRSIINKSFPQKKYDYLFEGGSAGCTYVFTTDFCLGLKSILEKINYVQWEYFSHDWFVYFYARTTGYKVSIDNKAYIKYRIHSDNVHGQLNKKSLFAIRQRLKLIKKGWYFKQIKGFNKITTPDSVENKIYHLYCKNYFSRLYVLFRYNFELMRSSKKFIQFFIISLLPIRINK
ncbi:Glycosyl transferase [Flavobacterium daejeonense]|nr:Glycosyl transferase [Flavobacterium daejeonense]